MSEVSVRLDERIATRAFLELPHGAQGLVLFAHGSGSSRYSPRNRFVAERLNERGLATLLFDLLTPQEDALDARTGTLHFNIHLLAERLAGATQWARAQSSLRQLALGYFGASTGAAAAMVAAATLPAEIAAVVSRGGRPDLAGGYLRLVRAPTLFIVGGADEVVIELNHGAAALLSAEHSLAIVPGATHLFPEPGALEEVARLACDWFGRFLCNVKNR